MPQRFSSQRNLEVIKKNRLDPRNNMNGTWKYKRWYNPITEKGLPA